MYCSHCGYNNAPGAVLCAQCGVSLAPAPDAPYPGAPVGGPPAASPPQGEGYPPPAQAYPPATQATPSGEYPQPGQPGQPSPYPPATPSGEYPPGGQAPYGAGYPPGGVPPGYPPGYGGSGGGKSQRGLLVVVLVLLIVGALVAGAVLVVGGGDGGSDDEIVLEPIDLVAADSFTDSLDVDGGALGAVAGAALEAEDPREADVNDAGLSGQVAGGAEPALYGGSRDAQVCDVAALLTFMQDEGNADKAEAWAGALDIGVGDIPTYLETLTAVRLRYDTRVTNHGFGDGAATPFQSVLQAGTAVLVDNTGVPRVKCNCGNPLLPPESLGVSGDAALSLDDLAQNAEDAWEGFDPSEVVQVEAAGETLDAITIVDFDNGDLLDRPVGSDGVSKPDVGTGDVQITLEWTSDADLDLHVFEPDGNEIYFGNSGPSATGGQLDVDSNVGCTNDGSIENVFWPSGGAPSGDYTVQVVGYSVDGCGGGDFTLTIDLAGQESQVETGSVGEDEAAEFSFSV